MSISENLQYRLLEHIAYAETRNHSETIDEPNLGGAKNFCIGTHTELSPYLNFSSARDMKKNFNDDGNPIHFPYYLGRSVYLVACIKESPSIISKVNVIGVYTLSGMKEVMDIVQRKIGYFKDLYSDQDLNSNDFFDWMVIEFPEKLYNDTFDLLIRQTKNGILQIPTANYELLKEDDKEVKEYDRIKTQKVPIKSGYCIVS